MATERLYGIPPPGYRLPELARIGQTRLQVSDLDRSLTYYTAVLGLRLLQSDSSTAAFGAEGGSSGPTARASDATIIELQERRGARPVPRSGVLGLFHFAILLPDRAALGRFARHLATVGVPFASADHFVSEAIYLSDPDGLGIEVYADRPRDMWQVRPAVPHAPLAAGTQDGRELVMGTEALDLRSLLQAAGTEPWTGVPTGTTMGHIHLSVGDLARARDFYHSALGFDAVVWSYPGALFLSVGGYHHHLGTNTWAAGARPATVEDARLLEWELVLPATSDVDAAAASMQRAGYEVLTSGNDRLLSDPWGITLRLRAGQQTQHEGTKDTKELSF